MQRYAEKAIVAEMTMTPPVSGEKAASSHPKPGCSSEILCSCPWQCPEKMHEMHDKLVKDISDLNARKDAIKAKMAVAKTQE